MIRIFSNTVEKLLNIQQNQLIIQVLHSHESKLKLKNRKFFK